MLIDAISLWRDPAFSRFVWTKFQPNLMIPPIVAVKIINNSKFTILGDIGFGLAYNTAMKIEFKGFKFSTPGVPEVQITNPNNFFSGTSK